jgi:hypothetical protein
MANTQTTPEQYWVSLTPSQQTYLRKLIAQKSLPILALLSIGLIAGTYYASKKFKI